MSRDENISSGEGPEATETLDPVEESEDEEVILNKNVHRRRGQSKAIEPSPKDQPKSNRRGLNKKTNHDLSHVDGITSTEKVNFGGGPSKTAIVKPSNQSQSSTAEKRKVAKERKTKTDNDDEDLSVESSNASARNVNTRRGRSKPTAVDPELECVAANSRDVQTRRVRRKEIFQDDKPSPQEQPTPIEKSSEQEITRRGSSKAVEAGNASKQANISEKRKTARDKKENIKQLDADVPIGNGNLSSEQVTTRRGGSSRGVEPEILPDLSTVAEKRKPQRDRKTDTKTTEENFPTTSANVSKDRRKKTNKSASRGNNTVEVNKDEAINQSSTPVQTSDAVKPSATRRSYLPQKVNEEASETKSKKKQAVLPNSKKPEPAKKVGATKRRAQTPGIEITFESTHLKV